MKNKTLNPQYPKNEPCYCGSGQLYKFCCINLEKRKDLINIHRESKSKEELNTDSFFNVALAQMAQEGIGLKNFCKQNHCYLFSSILTIAECDELNLSLKRNNLHFTTLTNLYNKKISELGEEKILEIVNGKCASYKYYHSRNSIICDAIKCHYLGLFTVSIPIFIIQIESILRELGQLDTKDNFKPTIKEINIKNEPLYSVKDDIKYFNSFIYQLFEGNRSIEKFNRNTILHGFNIDYNNETNSTLMLLALLEISNFLRWENNIKNFKSFS